ncbi:vacuolar protein [Rhizoctonia solani AG-3 Rhs1AP]|uniref:Vacuolar protein n=1 Tax=Rhizoctonia solani AG-3 Rhs1AP TaxID=1086054 RepID=A0A0A1UJE3_9AGAM|nr:vacuolar protein [Rhizoctonia solani AG-3 Rhs1AP]
MLGIAIACLLPVVLACGGDHDHVHPKRMQPDATASSSWPSAPLEWGDINFLHTTDSHGWLLGHTKASQPEPNYSGDFGDFASFVTNMKQIADKKGVDLLLLDSGDLHDGTGLSDGFPIGQIDGQESNKFFFDVPYDVLAIGNHELYQYPIALDMHQNFAPRWNGRYLSSNVNITYTDKNGRLVNTSVGDRFVKFRTKHKRKVTAFGVLFDFTGNAANTTVQKVSAMVNETWFKDAIQEEPDLFLLVGHMPVQKDNWPYVFNAIRTVHPTTPIFIFGGHTHIRDCVQLDSRSMSLESGRYLETVGWMSAKLPKAVNSSAPLSVTRRYLDPNRNTYTYHTQTKRFDTAKGKKITAGVNALAKAWNLTQVYGAAPRDYYLSRTPYPSNSSVLTLLVNEVIPKALAIGNPSRASIPSTVIVNSGSQRFDLYAGPFTRNDQFIVSPFNDAFLYFQVPASVAKDVLDRLNERGANKKRGTEDPDAYARGEVDHRFNEWRRDQYERIHRERATVNLTLGYVTTDSCPGVGDDTLHSPIPYYDAPGYIASPLPFGLADDTLVDLVFLDFFEPDVLQIVNDLSVGTGKTYSTSDVQQYGSGDLLTNTIYSIFATAEWN